MTFSSSHRRQVPDARVNTFFVVHLFDEPGQVFQHVEIRFVVHQIDFLLLERFHEPLDDGVVIRIATGRVGEQEVVFVQQLHVRLAQILNAAVRVMDAPGRWSACLDRLAQRGERQLRIDVLGDRPTNDAPGVVIKNRPTAYLFRVNRADS